MKVIKTINIDKALIEKIEKIAKEKDRSVSYVINKLLKEALNGQ